MTEIFVFGSNLAGRHGKGSALEAAQKHGARRGVGIGPTGNAYAIPTKDENLNSLHHTTINFHVQRFKTYAAQHTDLTFRVVAIECGLAGYRPDCIAPMFEGCTHNVSLPPEFLAVLETRR